jgi:hypothetical protein
MGTTLIIGNAIVGSSGIPLVAPLAIISNTLASEILDTGFKVETDVLPNGVDTTVFLHWGLTSAMTETPIEFTESPVLGTEIVPVTLDYVLTGLLPYRRYFFQIEAINLNGTVLSSIYNEITLEPLELTDGNWVAQYEGDYEKNVPYSVNASYIAELRDKRFDCALGIECNPQPSFDAAAGIGLATGITISGGNLIFTNVAHGVNAYFQIPAPERVNGAYRVEMPGVSGRSGVIYNVSSGQVLAAGVARS